jgi:hypothetical protein
VRLRAAAARRWQEEAGARTQDLTVIATSNRERINANHADQADEQKDLDALIYFSRAGSVFDPTAFPSLIRKWMPWCLSANGAVFVRWVAG